MLYDSTKLLLQGILRALETNDENRFDDQTQAGNACLYEMHQMSGPLYTPFRSDKPNANARAQYRHPEELTRAIPHVRNMVIAIRHKDQIRALESGRMALNELNDTRLTVVSGGRTKQAPETSEVRQESKPTPRQLVLVKGGGPSGKRGMTLCQ